MVSDDPGYPPPPPRRAAVARVQNVPKQPPHSIEAEQSVLGGLLLRNDLFADVSRLVGSDDFYRTDHQVIFSVIAAMVTARKTCDAITLTEHLRVLGKIDEAGGANYLGLLASENYSIANVIAYTEVVRERSVLRKLIAAGSDIGDMGYAPSGRSPDDLLESAERLVYELRQSRKLANDSGLRAVGDFAGEAENEIERLYRAGGGMGGFSTGFSWTNRMLDGLHPGDLVIVAGRPGNGKSTLAMNIAEHVAMDVGSRRRADVFSMEMQGKQLALRTLAKLSRVPLHTLRSGSLDQEQWDRMAVAGGALRAARIQIDETGALSPLELRSRVRRSAARGDLALVVVDYIQLMQVPGTRENRTNQVSEITRALKAMAKEFGVAVIALSQLSRANDKENRRPKLSDLRDSGGIEQDADVVLMIHRVDQPDADAEEQPERGVSEIIIAKQRQGQTGIRRMAFVGPFCKFEEMSEQDERDFRAREVARNPARGFGRLADGKAKAAGADA